MRPLLESHQALNGFISLPNGNLPAWERIETLGKIFKETHIDTIIHLNPNAVVEQAAHKAGIEERIGFLDAKNKNGFPWLTRHLPDIRHLGGRHEASFCFDLLSFLDIKQPTDLKPSLAIDPEYRVKAADLIALNAGSDSYVVFHLAAYANKPRIPVKWFNAVADLIEQKAGFSFVIIGADPSDVSVVEFMTKNQHRKNKLIDLTGKTGLGELAWILSEAKLVVTRDSGPAHMAAAMGTPTVTVMLVPDHIGGHQRWRPLGPHTYPVEKPMKRRFWENDARFLRRHIRSMNVSDVLGKVEEALEKTKENGRNAPRPIEHQSHHETRNWVGGGQTPDAV